MNSVFLNSSGVVTSRAVGVEGNRKWWSTEQNAESSEDGIAHQFRMTGFKPAPYLSDKRLLKAVSEADAIGLVAIEDLKKTLHSSEQDDPYRKGLYVGSPPASAFDNQFYFDAMAAAGRSGVTEFGATCMQSRPTTLLIGLPNNVLCYGSILLGVKGPNSNYTSTFLSGHVALINAARRIRRGQVDSAVAGGFSMHSEAVNSAMFDMLGVATTGIEKAGSKKMAQIADGAVFLGLSNRPGDGDLVAEYIDGVIAGDGAGPVNFDPYGRAFEKMIIDLLSRNSVGKESVGLILANASGFGQLDACENTVLSRVYANERVKPALGCSRKVFGNLIEAGGLLEIACISDLYRAGKIPTQMQLQEYDSDLIKFSDQVDENRPYTLVLRASPWGEYSAVLAKITANSSRGTK